MPGRGPQTFKKRQKEQQRKEKQEAKIARRQGRANTGEPSNEPAPAHETEPQEAVNAPSEESSAAS
jgi:hypothetical protein